VSLGFHHFQEGTVNIESCYLCSIGGLGVMGLVVGI